MAINTLAAIIAAASQQLTSVSDVARLEANLLMQQVLSCSRSYLITHDEYELTAEQLKKFEALLLRRLAKEPLAYILGYKEFWSHEFLVNQATLIPRPETEILLTKALQLANSPDGKIIDLGTGSGALAISFAKERPDWQVSAVDYSLNALAVARKNAARLQAKITFWQSDWLAQVPADRFDIIISNPPYLTHSEYDALKDNLIYEPAQALVADNNGLIHYVTIANQAWHFLKPNGYVIVEHGATQALQIQKIFADNNYSAIATLPDLAGLDRITLACRATTS